MQLPEFSKQQSELLSQFLAQHQDALSLAQTQGYLFAVICAPEPLDVHQWLEEVAPGSDGQMDEQVLFAFMALYQQISEQVFETGFTLPVSLQLSSQGQQYLDIQECQHWSQGFMHGAQGYVNKLLSAPELADELKEALATALQSLAFFTLETSEIAALATDNGLSEGQLCQQQYEVMNEFAAGFAELIEVVAVNSQLYNDEGWN
ncbi:YecA/YgfB family protein [Pseudoalteromonas shioyasakiensis]|uniref:YecA/YgfB family protein n=1 Tax=Pseudoalteromonas shioyasakiensis TaxID=1190813 RepID=UPI001C3C6CB3|nr:YecA family protein [Pseudoalteromonas shioyasakiensis]